MAYLNRRIFHCHQLVTQLIRPRLIRKLTDCLLDDPISSGNYRIPFLRFHSPLLSIQMINLSEINRDKRQQSGISRLQVLQIRPITLIIQFTLTIQESQSLQGNINIKLTQMTLIQGKKPLVIQRHGRLDPYCSIHQEIIK